MTKFKRITLCIEQSQYRFLGLMSAVANKDKSELVRGYLDDAMNKDMEFLEKNIKDGGNDEAITE